MFGFFCIQCGDVAQWFRTSEFESEDPGLEPLTGQGVNQHFMSFRLLLLRLNAGMVMSDLESL